jgi:hypothetical protein
VGAGEQGCGASARWEACRLLAKSNTAFTTKACSPLMSRSNVWEDGLEDGLLV